MTFFKWPHHRKASKDSAKKPSKHPSVSSALAYISVAPLLALSATSYAQSSSGSSDILERYGNLNVERSGPTIDAELANKLYRRGNTYSNLERYDEAIDEYRKAISADPSHSEAVRNLANIYFFLERYTEAKPLFARFISLQGENITAALIAAVSALGDLERKDGNYETSLIYDIRAIALNPLNDSQVHVMANTYNNAGESEKAVAVYRAGIEASPDNAFFDRSLGRILEQEGNLTDALVAYEAAAGKDPDSQFYVDLVDSTKRRLDR